MTPRVGRPVGKKNSRHFIREWRKYRHLTQEQLCGRLSGEAACDRSHLSKIERGAVNLTEGMIYQIADALSIEPGWIWVHPDVIMRERETLRVLNGIPDEKKEAVIAAIKTILGAA